MRRLRVEKEEERLDDEANIVRVATLFRVKSGSKVKEKASKEFLSNFRARMEVKQSERERAEF